MVEEKIHVSKIYQFWTESERKKLTTGQHNDDGKPRWELLPYDALDQVVGVMTYGDIKYPNPPRNWELGIQYSRIFASLIRHAWKWFMAKVTGQSGKDPESGLSHMAHVVCNGLFLLTYEVRGMDAFDDRPTRNLGISSEK